MRFFKINAALLALILAVAAIVSFFSIVRIFGHFTEFGTPLNFIAWLFLAAIESPYFHLKNNRLFDLLDIPAILIQTWLMFLVGILFFRHVFSKDNPKTLKIIIANLTIALITLLGFLIHSQLWQISNWQSEVWSLAGSKGAEEAKQDFQVGKLKKKIIAGECAEDKFSGTNEGPFEVWTAQYYPALPWPYHYSVEQEIKSYNLRMRSLYEWSLTHTNAVKSSR